MSPSFDLTPEIRFQTARSGGKGGQNVNKVETMVEGYWNIESSRFFSTEEKIIIQTKLKNKINLDGDLLVKSQAKRSQLENKKEVIRKMGEFVLKSLIIPKKRIPTRPSKASKENRIQLKKLNALKKLNRKKES